MRLNTKMRYGTRAMLELALRYSEGVTSLSEIATSQDVSEKYLEALFAALRAARLVQSHRGPKGGYVLARPPEQITLRDIFDVLESPEPYVPCTSESGSCERWATCVTQHVWAEMYSASMQVLASTTLADLVAAEGAQCHPAWSYEI